MQTNLQQQTQALDNQSSGEENLEAWDIIKT